MINIYLSYIHCDEETDEVGNDEPYVLAVGVALTPSMPGVPVQAPIASDVVVYPFRRMHTGGRAAFGIFESFWGIGGIPSPLVNPNDAIFIVAMMENDDGDPEVTRGVVDTAVNASLIESLALARPAKVTTLIHDVDSARRLPTGVPNFDDAIGAPQELYFSARELQLAEAGQTVSKTLVFEGDGGRYTLMFEARNFAWRPWVPLHPETVFDRANQKVTAIARSHGNLDLFLIGFDNVVWTTFWTQGGGWNPQGWFQLYPETVFDRANQQVTAIARTSGNLDLFVIGFDNAVWTTFWTQDGGWNPRGWFQIHPETVFDHTKQRVAAIARTSGNLDLFVVGFDNALWTTFWTQDGGWNPQGWFQIHPETVFDHATQQLAVASRLPDNLDLFVIGFDNAVWTTFWTQGGGWNPEGWFQIHPETTFDRMNQQVTAISRSPNNLDLFVVGFDNAVWTTFWTQDGGWNPQGWFQINPETVFDHMAQQIVAVSRSQGNLDLFIIGFDNAVWSIAWTQSGGWNQQGWFQVRPETVFDHTTQQIAAVARTSDNLDLFVIGFDNAVWSTWWSG